MPGKALARSARLIYRMTLSCRPGREAGL